MKDAMTLPIMNKRNLGKTLGLAGTLALLTTPLVGVGRAQPQASSTITFEAASVKPNNSADMRATNWQFLPGGRFTATNLPLFAIIALAYNVPFQSLVFPEGLTGFARQNTISRRPLGWVQFQSEYQ